MAPVTFCAYTQVQCIEFIIIATYLTHCMRCWSQLVVAPPSGISVGNLRVALVSGPLGVGSIGLEGVNMVCAGPAPRVARALADASTANLALSIPTSQLLSPDSAGALELRRNYSRRAPKVLSLDEPSPRFVSYVEFAYTPTRPAPPISQARANEVLGLVEQGMKERCVIRRDQLLWAFRVRSKRGDGSDSHLHFLCPFYMRLTMRSFQLPDRMPCSAVHCCVLLPSARCMPATHTLVSLPHGAGLWLRSS